MTSHGRSLPLADQTSKLIDRRPGAGLDDAGPVERMHAVPALQQFSPFRSIPSAVT